MTYKLLAALSFALLSMYSVCSGEPAARDVTPSREKLGDYVIIGWNDLGMHCMNGEFSQLVILPPYNNLWVQVVKRGDPPLLISSGVELEYSFPGNTTSSDKVNFWDYDQAIFGVDLPSDVGLAGKGLSGSMEWNGTAWEAQGIPVTPFDDATPTLEQPYQLAEVSLRLEPNGEVIDQTQVVVPVSTEMHCDLCHDGRDDKMSEATISDLQKRAANPGDYISVMGTEFKRAIDPVIVAQDILREHDDVDGQSLMEMRPVLCASCHASNALGTTGRPGLKSLSQAIHEKHGGIFEAMDCYSCHPGSKTQCLRGAMYSAGHSCQDCHGTTRQVAESIDEGRRPWFDEPKCGTCHPGHEENPNTLYRNSIGHGGMYCTACHGSPHAEYPSTQPRDNFQSIRVQGTQGTIYNCLVCHTNQPKAPGPHGLVPADSEFWLAF